MENRNGGTHALKLEKKYWCSTLAYSKETKYLVGPLLANGLGKYFVGKNIANNVRPYTVKRYLITPEYEKEKYMLLSFTFALFLSQI